MTAIIAAATTTSGDAAGGDFLAPLDRLGRFLLHYINSTTFGLFALAVLIVMLLFRRKQSMITHRSHCFRLAAGMLELYLAITLWIVFSLTHPPAFELLSKELLPYVGLVTLIVMFSSGLVSIKYAFSDNAKKNGDAPAEPGVAPAPPVA